jgi:hypothetical protein
MGQIDRETDAALAQIEFETLSTTPGGEFAEIVGDLLKLVGGGSPLGIAGGVSNLLLKVRKLAGAVEHTDQRSIPNLLPMGWQGRLGRGDC